MIEIFNPGLCRGKQSLIIRHTLRRSVVEIREEGKRQLRIGTAQEMEFQLLQQGSEFVGVCQQGWYYHHRTEIGWDAF